MLEKIKETVAYLESRTNVKPTIGIILGTGLGGLVKEINAIDVISYEEIPNFPVSTVEGHSGKLIFGELGGKHVIAMQGRFHYYEGYSLQEVTFPVRVMKLLGIERLFVSNASGGVNPDFEVGEIMIMNDHINLFPGNPLIGKNVEELGTRFPDMSEPYSKELIAKAVAIAKANNIHVHQGVYTAVTGPTFETHAEYRLIKVIGSDVVGMSTVQENIAAVHCGMKVFAVSVVTDLGIREDDNVITHEEVLQAAKEAEPKLTILFTELAKAVGQIKMASGN
jgi:purine-nucleoside phosphorylase